MRQLFGRATFTRITNDGWDLSGVDLSDKTSLAPDIWRVNLPLIVLVGVVVSLRVFTRAYLTGHLFVDDILAIMATVFTLGSASTALIGTRYGLGNHVWNLPLPVSNIMEMVTRCVQVRLVVPLARGIRVAGDSRLTTTRFIPPAALCSTRLLCRRNSLHQAVHHHVVLANLLAAQGPDADAVRDGGGGDRNWRQRHVCHHLPVHSGASGVGLCHRGRHLLPLFRLSLRQRGSQHRDRLCAGGGAVAVFLVAQLAGATEGHDLHSLRRRLHVGHDT